jgi:hypothetical protein
MVSRDGVRGLDGTCTARVTVTAPEMVSPEMVSEDSKCLRWCQRTRNESFDTFPEEPELSQQPAPSSRRSASPSGSTTKKSTLRAVPGLCPPPCTSARCRR